MVGHRDAPMKSPCVSICIDKEGICQGCGRTLYEIKMWTSFSDDVKLEVKEQAERRKANINIVRGESDDL